MSKLGSYAIGISYPFRRDSGQFPKMDKGAECVKSDLMTLFRTPIRSRVMRPTLGSDAERYVFEPNNDFLQILLERSIKSTIVFNEPRVDIIKYTFSQSGTMIVTDILYSVQGQYDSLTMQFDKNG